MKKLLFFGAFVAVLITAGCSSVDEMPQIKEKPQEMLAPGHVPRSVSCNILNNVLVKANFKTSDGVATQQ